MLHHLLSNPGLCSWGPELPRVLPIAPHVKLGVTKDRYQKKSTHEKQLNGLQVTWMNHVLATLWPSYNQAIGKMALETAEPYISDITKQVRDRPCPPPPPPPCSSLLHLLIQEDHTLYLLSEDTIDLVLSFVKVTSREFYLPLWILLPAVPHFVEIILFLLSYIGLD